MASLNSCKAHKTPNANHTNCNPIFQIPIQYHDEVHFFAVSRPCSTVLLQLTALCCFVDQSYINYMSLSERHLHRAHPPSSTSPSHIASVRRIGLSRQRVIVFPHPQFTGKAYAPEYPLPSDTLLTTAVGDMGTAHLNAIGRHQRRRGRTTPTTHSTSLSNRPPLSDGRSVTLDRYQYRG
jgi:hypothetical protein